MTLFSINDNILTTIQCLLPIHYASKCIYKENYKKYDDDEINSRYRRHDFKKMTNNRDKGKRIFSFMEAHSSKEKYGED